jgi:hypothetical protein
MSNYAARQQILYGNDVERSYYTIFPSNKFYIKEASKCGQARSNGGCARRYYRIDEYGNEIRTEPFEFVKMNCPGCGGIFCEDCMKGTRIFPGGRLRVCKLCATGASWDGEAQRYMRLINADAAAAARPPPAREPLVLADPFDMSDDDQEQGQEQGQGQEQVPDLDSDSDSEEGPPVGDSDTDIEGGGSRKRRTRRRTRRKTKRRKTRRRKTKRRKTRKTKRRKQGSKKKKQRKKTRTKRRR